MLGEEGRKKQTCQRGCDSTHIPCDMRGTWNVPRKLFVMALLQDVSPTMSARVCRQRW